MRRNGWAIIDGDGHVRERDTELLEFLDEPYRSPTTLNFPFFPTLDGFQRGAGGARRGKREPLIDAQAWLNFLDDAEMESTVLYPTAGLGVGMIQDPLWATAVCRGYNNWFHKLYHGVSPRLMGVALLPLQDVQEAVKELRRAVTELGMVGGMLPANSADMGVRKALGDREFWPLYAEAERLDCPLAVHGAPSVGLGVSILGASGGAQILEHPLSQMIQMTSMMLSGMFDEFRTLRVAYLEADTGWVPYMMDRLHGRARGGISDPADVISSGRIYFSCQSGEQSLRYAIERLGEDVVLYASDYPHESKDDILEEVDELIGRTDLSESSKRKILKDNTLRFYHLEN